MLNILHYGLSRNRGGIETYLWKIWNNIDREQFKFDFIYTCDSKPALYDEFFQTGAGLHKITDRKKSYIQNKKEWNALFENNKFDVFHCHLNTLSEITPVFSALHHKVPVIVHSRSAGVANSLPTKLLHKINSIRLPKDKITMVAVSDKAGKWLFGDNTKYLVINNGIDTEKFRFSEQHRKIIRAQFGLENNLIIGNVGAFNYAKNHEFIISVFAELKKIRKDAVLFLIGEGLMRETIKTMSASLGINDSIYFLENRSDVPELLSTMDLFIMPSRYEGFPNAALEAQTSGLPCFLSENITKEVSVIPSCCYLSLDAPVKTWTDKILDFTTSFEREQAYSYIENAGFSAKQEIIKIENLYKSVLKIIE